MPVELIAQPHWRRVDFISDLHLHSSEPQTHAVWARYMRDTKADALFILGDLFEVWVGDDTLTDAQSFESACVSTIRSTAARIPVYCIVGNRDFLLSQEFSAAAQAQLLPDPTTLTFAAHRIVLTHGDAWCVDDVDYQAFRRTVRSADWQAHFLKRPLPERRAIASDIRLQSEKKKEVASYADVDHSVAQEALASADATYLIHGHTHKPTTHEMEHGTQRWVLSDWHIQGKASDRAEVLRLERQPISDSLMWTRLAPHNAC